MIIKKIICQPTNASCLWKYISFTGLLLLLIACHPVTSPTGISYTPLSPTKIATSEPTQLIVGPIEVPKPTQIPTVKPTPTIQPTFPAGASWSSLGKLWPLEIEFGGHRFIHFAPTHAEFIAFCDNSGGIYLTKDNGEHFTQIPTDKVVGEAEKMGLIIQDFGKGMVYPRCIDVALDTQTKEVVYTTFWTLRKENSGDPLSGFLVGFYSEDYGNSWQIMKGFDGIDSHLAGITTDDQGVLAYFFDKTVPYSFDLEQKSWKPASYPCAKETPCVHWGVFPPVYGPMSQPKIQELISSHDSGATWNPVLQMDSSTAQPAQLIMLSDQRIMAIGPVISKGKLMSWNMMLVSNDLGSQWKVVNLPDLPDPSPTDDPYYHLQMLSNGSLIAVSQVGWQLLKPGAADWCILQQQDIPRDNSGLLTSTRDELWWIGSKESQPKFYKIPLEQLNCKN